jgi:energy-coupling factor transporter ATP-binding protein EcfA2
VASPLITLRGATVAHSDELPPVLHEISLSIERGDWIAVAGDNGSGKTTLLAAAAGVLPLRSGTIERASGLRVALLIQEPDNQLVASSVGRELALSVPLDVAAALRGSRIEAAIERFELEALLDRNPHRLSGGEKQRLALATVWLENPDVLLLDEPLSYLDGEMSARVVAFVREMNAGGVAILWATPGGDDVALARDVIVLRDGHVASGAGPESYKGAGGAETGTGRGLSTPRVARRQDPRREGDVRLRFESVSFAYDGRTIFDDVTFQASAGECVGIAGKNGSGKSTLLLLAGGALKPSSGRIERNVREHGVLYLPQSPERLFFAETVLEEIGFGLERRGVSKDEARAKSMAALELASLDPGPFASRSPFELSFGEMRRVAFAIAFALEPELLLLDEPASCLDSEGIGVLERLIGHFAAKGSAVLIASHEDASAWNYDRVVTVERRKERADMP